MARSRGIVTRDRGDRTHRALRRLRHESPPLKDQKRRRRRPVAAIAAGHGGSGAPPREQPLHRRASLGR